MVNPKISIKNTAPISDSGIATIGMSTERERAQEQEDDEHHDQQRLDERADDLVDRVRRCTAVAS